ncbi:unnamed protein product, partial [Dovyalis caffra]
MHENERNQTYLMNKENEVRVLEKKKSDRSDNFTNISKTTSSKARMNQEVVEIGE